MSGLLVLNGGDEFKPGNEPQDRLLVTAAAGGPAYVVTTAAARQRPDLAAATARRWFATLGLEIEELPLHRRSDAASAELVERARGARLLYLCGGDPGLVATVLRGSAAWDAMLAAWRAGAALAGSSAGAMALCRWTLIRKTWPNRAVRTYRDALDVVPGAVVLPHFDTFGERWIESAQAESPIANVTLIGVDERSAAVWDGKRWTAHGAGRVVAIRGEARDEARDGGAVQLPEPAPG
jgi:cyanophycinase